MDEIFTFSGSITSNGLKIIYEDNHIISVIKPAGILSQSDSSNDQDLLTMIKEDLKVRYNKKGEAFAGLVHRLDRNTGGTIVYAKTSKGASRLSSQLREKQFKKGYFAIATGIIKNDGTLINMLHKDNKTNTVYESSQGKESVLKYRVIDSIKDSTLLFVIPITGRTHQIRVQFSLSGHPLLGDVKYGYEKESDNALALWSSVCIFNHVTESKKICLQSVPEAKEFWNQYDNNIYVRTLNNMGDLLCQMN